MCEREVVGDELKGQDGMTQPRDCMGLCFPLILSVSFLIMRHVWILSLSAPASSKSQVQTCRMCAFSKPLKTLARS